MARTGSAFEICRDNTIMRLESMKRRARRYRKADKRFGHVSFRKSIAMNMGDRLLCRHGTSQADVRVLTNMRKFAFPEVLDHIDNG